MENFPVLKGNKIVLKEMHLHDAEAIYNLAKNENVSKYTLNIPYPYKMEDAVWWINNAKEKFKTKEQFTFGIFILDTEEFIGGIGLIVDQKNSKASIGYWVGEPFWNKGYTTEALKLILNFGFNDLQLNKLFAHHLVENTASGRVMQKAGMILEAELKEHNCKNGVFRDIKQYRLTRKEFQDL